MKNISILLVLSFLFIAHTSWAQPTFYVSPDYQLVDQGETPCYDIKTRDFSFLLGVSFTLRWDPGVMSNAAVTPTSLHPLIDGLDMSDFTVNDMEGYMTFEWSNGEPCDVTDPNLNVTLFDDDETIFQICFEATGIYGNHTSITFSDDPVEQEVKRYNANCQDIGEFTYDGHLSIGTDPLRVNISSADGFQGETVCIDLTVEDFDNLISNQYYIFWNPDVLLFENALASGLPGFGPGSLNFSLPGMGVVSWNAIGSPVTVPDGTQILQLCFKIIGNCGQSSPIVIDDNGDELVEIIDFITDTTNGTNIGLLDSPGEVSVKCFNPNGINMTIEDKEVCPGETFTVDITVDNFEDIVKLQFGLKWNPSIIQLLNTSGDGITFPPNDSNEPCFQFDTPGTIQTFPTEGRLEVDWSGGFFSSCSLNDGSLLMQLNFQAVGASGTNSTVSVVQPILVDLVGGQVVNVGINNDNSLVSICELDSPTLIVSSDEANPGENICVDITALDFENVTTTFYNISWEPNILSYTGVQNFNLPGLSDFSFLTGQTQSLGDLGVAWDAGMGVSVPDGTTLFEVCFDVIGNPDSCSQIQFTENLVPINIETEASNGTNVGLNGQGGNACVLDPFEFILFAENKYGTPGEHVTIDITVENFIQLKRLQHSMSWKAEIIQYDSLVSTGVIPGFTNIHYDDSAPDIDNGQMRINWSTNNINGISIPDGTAIYTLHFTILGDPGDCSGVKIDDWLVPYVVNSALTGSSNLGLVAENGSVCVNQSFISVADVEITHVDCPSTPDGVIDLTITGGSGTYDYNWAGNGVIPTLEDQAGLSPGFYDVTVTDDENPSLKLELSFQVELSPTAPIADAGVDTSFSCISGVSTLTLNGSGSTQTGVSYFWDNISTGFPGIITGGETTLTPTVIGGTGYVLTVSQASTGCVVTDTVMVSSPVNPNPEIAALVMDQITCRNDTITLNGGQPQNIFDFEWIAGPGGNIVPDTDTSLSPRITSSAWYYYHMFHPTTGCEAMDSIFVGENLIAPDSDGGDDTSIGCSEDEIQLDGNNSTLDNTTFLWLPTNGGEICGADNEITVGACAPGTYQLIVTDTLNGCSSMAEVLVEGDTLRPDAIAGPDTLLNCVVESIVLDGSASSQGGSITYTWLDDQGMVLGDGITYETSSPGTFTLEVMDQSNGCMASSEVFVDENKTQPAAIATVNHPITCDSLSATLDATGSSVGPEFSYEWMDPTGGFAGTDMKIEVTEPGVYTLFVKNDENECVEEFMIEVEDQDDAIPVEAGDDNMIGCVGGVVLDGSFTSSNTNIQIQWSSAVTGCITDGMTTSPTIECAGTYIMTVFDPATGCFGVDSLTVDLDDSQPVISAGDNDIFPCSSPTYQLNGSSDLTDVTIVWSNGDMLPISDPGALSPTIEEPGIYTLIVTSNSNQCSSISSVEITEPDLPISFIEGDTIADCAIPTVTLTGANSSMGVSYLWEAITGSIPAGQQNQVEVMVPAGEYLLTVTDQNGCSGTDTHLVEPNSDLPNADAGSNSEIPCDADFITLDGSNSDPGMEYLWTDASGMIIGNGLMVDVTETGNYLLTVTNPDNQCQSVASIEVVQATSGGEPAEASFDHDPCAIEAILMGNLPEGTTGSWTSTTGAIIDEPMVETTMTSGLSQGENIFFWSLSKGSCTDYSSAQIIINVDQSVPEPMDDSAVLAAGIGGTLTTNVLLNDAFDPALTTFNVTTTNVPGEMTWNDNGEITFTKFKCVIGEVAISYELCNSECPELCKSATYVIDVLPDEADACGEVPNGITPNGDGVNDELIFDQLLDTTEDYPRNELIVFNRWGDIVYQARPYLNDWNGVNDSGDQLPHGTYYYIFRLDLANSEIIRGDITILK